MSTELSTAYSEAIGVHNNILAHAQIAQQSLWEMGTGIKRMRDGKLYKELGYQNFEEYCEQALEIKRRQAYSYISVVENLGEDFVHSGAQNLGVKKLYLLSTLSESDRQELTDRVDVEDVSTRQLKEEIDRLKNENTGLTEANLELSRACQDAHACRADAERRNAQLEQKASEMSRQIKELESRPIEVIASDAADAEQKISEALEEEARRHEAEMSALRQQYESRLKTAGGSDCKAVFKVHFRTAYNAFNSMMAFVRDAPEEEKPFLLEQTEKLLSAVGKVMQEV